MQSSYIWIIIPVATVAVHASTASAEPTTSSSCSVQQDELQERGTALLQVASDSSSLKARTAASKAAHGTLKAAAAASSATGEAQLAQYTKLKQTLAASSETADVMKKIDEALDSKPASAGAFPDKAAVESIDDVLKVQSATSLLEENAERIKPRRRQVDEEEEEEEDDYPQKARFAKAPAKDEEEDEEEENQEAGDADEDEASTGEDENADEEKDSKAEDDEEESESSEDASNEDEDSKESEEDGEEESSEDSEDESSEDSEENANEDSEDESSEDSEDEDAVTDERDEDAVAETRVRKKLSLMAGMDILEADRAALDEDGYLDIASSRSNRRMERFVERLASEMNLQIKDIGGLKGMVPYYSGQKSLQSFDALQAELLSTARMNDGWLIKMRSKRRRENLLLQTGSTQHETSDSGPAGVRQATGLSLLGGARTAVQQFHKVPDMAMAMFGSRTLVLLCTMGLVGCLFCLDERKRTTKGVEYEDPLNMSPTPPPVKADPIVTANLKILRGEKNIATGSLQ